MLPAVPLKWELRRHDNILRNRDYSSRFGRDGVTDPRAHSLFEGDGNRSQEPRRRSQCLQRPAKQDDDESAALSGGGDCRGGFDGFPIEIRLNRCHDVQRS